MAAGGAVAAKGQPAEARGSAGRRQSLTEGISPATTGVRATNPGDSPAGRCSCGGASLPWPARRSRRWWSPGRWSGARRRVRPQPTRPGQQLPAHPIQLTDVAPTEAAQECPQGGWRLGHTAENPGRPAGAQRVGGVDAVAASQRRRNQGQLLSPVFARPGALPRSRRCWTSWGRPRCRTRVAGRISPALATRRRSAKAMRMRSGWLRGSLYRVLLLWGRFGNSSDLGGSEQLAAGGEGVQALGAPGAEDGCQRHLALGTTFRPGAPADLAADNQMAPAALGGVVVRRHVRFGHEDEEFLDVALDAPAQPALQS